jgi:DNA-binding IclR family transcriptional regulator
MTQQSTGKTQGVAAVDRALEVLDAFLDRGTPLTLAELARRTDLVKPTVLRALVSLARRGYVVRLADGRYQLGAKVMRLGVAYQMSFKLDEHVMPMLRHLAEATGEGASFYVHEQDKRICLFRVDSSQTVRDVVLVGDAMPIDASSTGQVFQAFAESAGSAATLHRVFSSSGVGRDVLSASLAVPVFGSGDVLLGALSLSGPISRFGPDETRSMERHLIDASNRLTSSLGGSVRLGTSPSGPDKTRP